jgi:hypothetical protein
MSPNRPAPRPHAPAWGIALLALAAALTGASDARAEGLHLDPSKSKDFGSSYWTTDDGKGFRWDIYSQYGYINSGTNGAYATGMYLQVNNNTFYANSRKVSADGNELEIGPWESGNVRVWRRIYVDKKKAYCRWIDIFQNTSPSVQTVSLQYKHHAGSTIQNIRSSSGGATIDKKDWAFVTDTASGSRPALAHVFASRGAKIKPEVAVTTSGNQMHYSLSLTLNAGQTAALCFFEAQRKDRDEAVAFMEQFRASSELASVPAALRKIIVNLSGPVASIGSLELPRHDRQDLAITLTGNRLLGEIVNKTYTVEAFYGTVELPAERVVGLAVPDVNDEHVLLALTDGQVVAGKLLSLPLRMKLATGSEMTLPISKLRTLAYRVSPDRPEDIQATEPTVILRSGEQVFFQRDGADCEYLTEHGRVTLDADDLRSVLYDTPEGGLHRVMFRNGTVLSGLWTNEDLSLKLDLGKTLKVKRHLVRSFVLATSPAANEDLAQVALRNEDTLYGKILADQLTFKTTFGDAPVKPWQIASIEFHTRPVGKVNVKLHGGSTIEGYLPAETKTLRFKLEPGPELDVFIGHIARLEVPRKYRWAEGEPDEEPDGAETEGASDDVNDDAESETTAASAPLSREQAEELKVRAAKTAAHIKQLQAVQAQLQAQAAALDQAGQGDQAKQCRERLADVDRKLSHEQAILAKLTAALKRRPASGPGGIDAVREPLKPRKPRDRIRVLRSR